jgi:hypothetical protein
MSETIEKMNGSCISACGHLPVSQTMLGHTQEGHGRERTPGTGMWLFRLLTAVVAIEASDGSQCRCRTASRTRCRTVFFFIRTRGVGKN